MSAIEFMWYHAWLENHTCIHRYKHSLVLNPEFVCKIAFLRDTNKLGKKVINRRKIRLTIDYWEKICCKNIWLTSDKWVYFFLTNLSNRILHIAFIVLYKVNIEQIRKPLIQCRSDSHIMRFFLLNSKIHIKSSLHTFSRTFLFVKSDQI